MIPETEPPGNMDAAPADRSTFYHQLAEVLVFLSLIVPSTILAQFAYKQEHATFALVGWATILRDMALVALIVFFLWRNGEPPRAIGWRFRWVDVGLGIVLFIPFVFLTSALEGLFQAIGLHVPSGPAPAYLVPRTAPDVVLAVILVVVVALSEETIFRGYLQLRFSRLTGSCALAVFIATVLFAIGHGYEGSAGVATVGVMGLIFGFVYIWRGSLVVPITMHFLQDFLGIVLLPLLGRR